MFCPKCKDEYRKGFCVCAECHVALVHELPLEPEYIEYAEVLRTFNQADIAFIKSILDLAGMTYCFIGEHFIYVQPFAVSARLMVKKDEADDAREILKEVELSYAGINLEKDT